MSRIRQKPCRNRHDGQMRSAGIIDEARELIGLAAGQRDWSDTREAWIARAARKLGISYARARKVWYRQVDDLWASEWMRMREKAEEIRQQLQEIEAANAELRSALERCNVRPVAGAPSRPEGAQGGGDLGVVAEDRGEGAGPSAAAAVPSVMAAAHMWRRG